MALALRRSTPSSQGGLDPVGELSQVNDRLSRLLDVWSWPSLFEDGASLADIEETDDSYIVELDLPGIDKSDIDVEMVGRRLIVSGERKEKERKGVLRHRARTVGQFRHEILLPGEIDPERVSATLASGTLTVVIAKPTSEKPKQIKIQ